MLPQRGKRAAVVFFPFVERGDALLGRQPLRIQFLAKCLEGRGQAFSLRERNGFLGSE